MNKKVMALAVAGVVAAPAAFAQSSNVQLYGRANLGFDQYQAEGSNIPNADRDARFRVFDSASRVGLRGTEDLGNGLKAIFQIETGVNIDNSGSTGQGGQGNTSSGFWGTRDSFVGLDSNFGRLTFGRQSVYWSNGVNAQFSANYINTEIPWTNGTQLGRISVAGTAPARVNNTVQYTTPTFAGMNLTASFSPDGQERVQSIGAGTDTNAALWALTGRGTWGPFYVQADYVNVKGGSPTQGATFVRPEGEAYKVGASWGYMPGARVGLIWVRTETNNGTGQVTGVLPGDEVNQDAWTLNWEHTFGNIQAMAQYGQLGDLKSCDNPVISCSNTKASAWMVGARYLLSKRTWVYLSYNEIDNKENQFVDYTGAGITSTVGGPTPFGADPRVIAIGMLHNF